MKKIKKLLTIGLAGLITFGMFTGCDLIENSSNDSQSGSSSCEHTYEWVGNEGGHQKVYTCGCPSPDIIELHRDNDGDDKCDVCGWSIAETLPEDAYLLIQAYEEKYPNAGKATILRYCGTYESGAIVAKLAGSDESFDCALWTETVADYDFNYSNGNRIRVLYGGEFYTLTQAYENGYLTKENIADIHIKWNGKLPELGDAYLHEFENWISNLMVDDVKEIKTTTEFIGVAPGRFKDIQRTTDKAVIADVINDYKSIIMTSVAREDAEIEGGGAFTIEFILANGDVQKIYFNNGIYDGNVTKPELSSLQYYRVETIPTLEKYRNVKNSYSFITYRSTYELFTIDDEKVGEFYGLDKFEFVERGETEIPDGETAIPPEEPTHYIVGDVGTMFICSDKVFYMENNGQRTYYELVGKVDFSQLFNDSPANGSNDIFYVSSYPQDFEYNGRHYRLVQGVGLKTTVTQEELGELLGYIIREEDVSAFTQEYPNVDYVIDNRIYDYETNNRVAFYSVKAHPDLSFICMHQLGDYVLFQDITDLLA